MTEVLPTLYTVLSACKLLVFTTYFQYFNDLSSFHTFRISNKFQWLKFFPHSSHGYNFSLWLFKCSIHSNDWSSSHTAHGFLMHVSYWFSHHTLNILMTEVLSTLFEFPIHFNDLSSSHTAHRGTISAFDYSNLLYILMTAVLPTLPMGF